MTTISYPHENQKQISTLDFQKVALVSYILRVLGAVIFGDCSMQQPTPSTPTQD